MGRERTGDRVSDGGQRGERSHREKDKGRRDDSRKRPRSVSRGRRRGDGEGDADAGGRRPAHEGRAAGGGRERSEATNEKNMQRGPRSEWRDLGRKWDNQDIDRKPERERRERADRGRERSQPSGEIRGREGGRGGGGRGRDDWGNRAIKREPESEDEEAKKRRKRALETKGGEPGAGPETAEKPPEEKQKPNFGLSGKLAEDTNTFNGVVVKYNEPGEARKPKRKWRLYPFKGEESLPFIPIHKQSAFLLGRNRKVADIPIDHPSCSQQHSVVQFRLIEFEREDGSVGKRIRPYLIDLDSSNGSYVNNVKIEPRRYYELFEKDVIKFGYSTREYVVLHEEFKGEEEDDDVSIHEEANPLPEK